MFMVRFQLMMHEKKKKVIIKILTFHFQFKLFCTKYMLAIKNINLKMVTSDLGSRSVCLGTNRRMSFPSNRSAHYLNLRDNYTNCTYIDGNLELTWLQEESLDLTFLQHIREVTGYVLISHVDVRRVVLPALQIIRGRTPFKLHVHDEEFALVVTLSKMHSLEMPALRGT
jgi:L1 cell adhesion molecule